MDMWFMEGYDTRVPCLTDDGWKVKGYDYDEMTAKPIVIWWCGDIDLLEDVDDEWPSQEKLDRRWLEYYEHVWRTCKDPIHAFTVRTTFKRMAKWQFRARRQLGEGLSVTVRRNSRGPWLGGTEIPRYVQEFFCIDPQVSKDGRLHDFESLDDMKENAHEVKWQRSRAPKLWAKGIVEIEELKERSPSAIARDLKQAAWQEYLKLKKGVTRG